MGWPCTYCTLINEDFEAICDGCGSSKTSDPRERPGFRGKMSNLLSGAVSIFSSFVDDVAMSSAIIGPAPPPAPKPAHYSVFTIPPEIPRHAPTPPPAPGSPFNSPQIITLDDTPPPRPPPPRRLQQLGGARAVESGDMPRTPVSRQTSAGSSIQSSPMKDQTVRAEKEAGNKLKEIELLCRQLNTSFIDDEFPPTEKSLGRLYDEAEAAIPGKLDVKSVVWLRPTEMFTKDGRRFRYSVFNDPSSSDIEQGSLGDCWLLSAMALIAERPDVLDKILLTKEYNSIGVYQIRLCVDGQWRVITVDDFFPCRKSTRTPAFAVGRKNQLWVPLVEKAYAKALGQYAMLRAGRTVEGLALLTGAPCESINLDDDDIEPDFVWARLLSAKEAGYIMGASCGAGRRQRVADHVTQSLGLLTNHAYSILDVRQEGPHRLVRVRNPWGSHVWKGPWSDEWSGWPADLKRRLLSSETRSQGAFWMAYDDFRLHFDSIDFAKIRHHLSWVELRVPCRIGGSWGNDAVALMLVVEQPTEICCSLFRGGSRTADDHEDLLICVHHVDPKGRLGELEIRSARNPCHMATTGDFFLRSGHYVITVLSLSSFNRDRFRLESTLVVHSNKLLFGETIACPPQMATDSLIQLALKEGEVKKSINGVIPRFVTKKFGGLLVMVDNFLKDRYVHVTNDCEQSANLLSSRAAMKVVDSIPPMSRQLVILLSHFDASNGFVVENRLSMRTAHQPAINDILPPAAAAAAGAAGAAGAARSIEHDPPFHHEASRQLHSPRSIT